MVGADHQGTGKLGRKAAGVACRRLRPRIHPLYTSGVRFTAGLVVIVCSTFLVAGAASSPQKPAPTFYKDILPLLQNHCQSCHRPGEVAPMPLVTYAQTRPLAPAIAKAVQSGIMPPWFADARFGHFSNDPSLTPQQISAVLAWVAGGAPVGDPHDAPAPPQWSEGWNIAKPDLVLPMPKPVSIPADGDVEYTYEIVPTHFAEDK